MPGTVEAMPTPAHATTTTTDGGPARRADRPLYTPRWRWPDQPVAAAWDGPLPLDILGVFPPRTTMDVYTQAGLPQPLRRQTPAAVLAILAAVDGFLPQGLWGASPALPQPFRVALFGPGAGAVLDLVQRLCGRLPDDRLLLAFAIRGRADEGEQALPPGWWPVLCGPQPPPPPGGEPTPSAGALRARLEAWGALPDGHLPDRAPSTHWAPFAAVGGSLARLDDLLPPPARSAAKVLPFLYRRLCVLTAALADAWGGATLEPWGATDAADDLTHAVFRDCVAFYARVRPLPWTPALRLARAILRTRPPTLARTTCGVAGVTPDDLCRLADIGWLEWPPGHDQCAYAPPPTGRWRVSEPLRSLPPLDLDGLGRSRRPVAISRRAL